MSGESTKAIVLRTIEFSETSLIITLLSRDFGRMSALAKGARRPKSSFEGSLDLLSVCRVVVIRKTSDALDLLTEAKLLRRFRGAERSLDRTYAGYYIAEMLRLLTDDHDPHPDLYDMSIATLQQIDGSGDVAGSLAYFDAQALRMVGHSPGLDACTVCGRRLEPAQRIAFGFTAGGIVCRGCRARQPKTVSVRRELVEEFRRLQRVELTPPVRVEPHVYRDFRPLVNQYVATMLGAVPRMQSYLPTAYRTEPTA